MPSQLQSDTARTNGGKSHGPTTPQGRSVSSRNSLRHGLTAKAVVLPGESLEEFQALLDSYIQQFKPASGVEADLIQAMAVTRWRLNRIAGIETNLFSNEMVSRKEDIDEKFTQDDDRLAYVFQKLADHGKTLPLLLRYEATLTRSYERACKQLHELQRARKAAAVPLCLDPRPSAPSPAGNGEGPRASVPNQGVNQGAKPESRNEPEPTPTADSTGLTPTGPETSPGEPLIYSRT
jgi:hypothetical protein